MAPFQNRPVSAWSADAGEPLAVPRDLISLRASAYASLSSAGGGPGRNWLARSRANGLTCGQLVNCGWEGKFGGVD